MEGVFVFPGKKICTQEGDADLGLGKTSDYIPGSNVYEKAGNI